LGAGAASFSFLLNLNDLEIKDLVVERVEETVVPTVVALSMVGCWDKPKPCRFQPARWDESQFPQPRVKDSK
jgi:hypothetical protein